MTNVSVPAWLIFCVIGLPLLLLIVVFGAIGIIAAIRASPENLPAVVQRVTRIFSILSRLAARTARSLPQSQSGELEVNERSLETETDASAPPDIANATGGDAVRTISGLTAGMAQALPQAQSNEREESGHQLETEVDASAPHNTAEAEGGDAPPTFVK